MSMQRDGNCIVIQISYDQYLTLLLALGTATGCMLKQSDRSLAMSYMRLADSINEGNPNWMPLEPPEPWESDPTYQSGA